MESQMSRYHHQEDDPHTTGEGEHQGEKKSVLKKVKEKAKKIKDTIKKHGHGHEHEHYNEEEDEEIVNDPELHGAPMYESAVITGTNLPVQTGLNLEKTTDKREDRYKPDVKNEIYSSLKDEGVSPPTGPGKMVPELGSYDLHVKNEVNPDVEDRGATTMLWGPRKMGMELERPPEEAREAVLNSPNWSSPYTVDIETVNVVETSNVEEPMVKIGPLEGIEEDPHGPKNRGGEIPTSNYQSKVTDPTGEGGKEVEVAPLIERLDNLHVHDETEPKPVPEPKSYTGSHDQFAPQPTPTEDQFTPGSNPITPSESLDSPKVYDIGDPESMPHDTIAEKISSATSVIAGKAVAAKNVVASKLGYGGEHEETEETSNKPASESPKVYDLADFESMPHGTIAGKILSATSVIADKAATAKNVIASKLGYSGEREQTEDTSKKPVSESPTEYAHKVADKLAPVYGKVAGTGSVIPAKVQGGGGPEEESRDEVVGETDKGASVKEYLAVKLSPGDEDKALSEVITEALHKKREVMQGAKPVAGAEDVATHSKNKREAEDAVAGWSEGSGSGAVDRLKDAVGSWFGKSSEHGEEEISGQQRRLQESGN